jgi:pantetheine-phosphate adenylyltransferase
MALITSEQHTFLSSTTVREIASLGGDISSMVPDHVRLAMKKKFEELGRDQTIVPMTQLRD